MILHIYCTCILYLFSLVGVWLRWASGRPRDTSLLYECGALRADLYNSPIWSNFLLSDEKCTQPLNYICDIRKYCIWAVTPIKSATRICKLVHFDWKVLSKNFSTVYDTAILPETGMSYTYGKHSTDTYESYFTCIKWYALSCVNFMMSNPI